MQGHLDPDLGPWAPQRSGTSLQPAHEGDRDHPTMASTSPKTQRTRLRATPTTPELNGIYIEAFERKMKRTRMAAATSAVPLSPTTSGTDPPPPPPPLPPLYDSAKSYAVKLLEGRETLVSSAHITSPGRINSEMYLPFGEQKLADIVFIEREGEGDDAESHLLLARSLASELDDSPVRVPPLPATVGADQPCDVVVFLYSPPPAKPHPFPRIADDHQPTPPPRSKPMRRGRSGAATVNAGGRRECSDAAATVTVPAPAPAPAYAYATAATTTATAAATTDTAVAIVTTATPTAATATAITDVTSGSAGTKSSGFRGKKRRVSSCERFVTLLRVIVGLLIFLCAIFVPLLVGNFFLQSGKGLVVNEPAGPATGARAASIATAASPPDAPSGNKFLARLFQLVRARRRQADRLAQVRDILRSDDAVSAYERSGKRGARWGARPSPWKSIWTTGIGSFGKNGGSGSASDSSGGGGTARTGSGIADWCW